MTEVDVQIVVETLLFTGQVVLLVPTILMVGYLLVLTVAAGHAHPVSSFAPRRLRRFALVIPAHNEESGISGTVTSLARVEYPTDLREIIVIADNCTDSTAAVAQEAGARVIVRQDPNFRGKGYALRFCFDTLINESAPFDAVVVIDADSSVSRNLLTVFNHYLDSGSSVIQGGDLVDPGSQSWSSQMTRIGFLLGGHIRLLGRKVLGCSAGLRGNGMCIGLDVLKAHPWTAFSIAEDYEFGIELLLAGEIVAYAPEATAFAVMPGDAGNTVSQRARWEGGRTRLVRKFFWPLLRRGLFPPRLRFIDAFMDLVTPALVTLALTIVGLISLSGILAVAGVSGMQEFALCWGASLVLLSVHVVLGLRTAGANAAVWRSLLHVPRYVIWKLRFLLMTKTPWKRDEWVRTKRES